MVRHLFSTCLGGASCLSATQLHDVIKTKLNTGRSPGIAAPLLCHRDSPAICHGQCGHATGQMWNCLIGCEWLSKMMKSEGNRKQISEIHIHPLLKPAGDGWIITENLVSCASVERLGCSKSGWVTCQIIWRASWFFHISRNHHVYIQAHHIFGCRCVFLWLVARDVMFCHVGLLQRSGTLWRLPYAMKAQCKGPLPSQAIKPWGCLMISVEPMDSKPYRAYLYMHIVHLLNIVVLQVTATYSFSGMP